MNEIVKNNGLFYPLISHKQALLVNEVNHYMTQMKSESEALVLSAQRQAQQIEGAAHSKLTDLLETKSFELHKQVCDRINTLLAKLTNGISEIITNIIHKQKLGVVNKDSLKELIVQDLRQYLDLDHIELTTNSVTNAELQDFLQMVTPERNIIFKIDNTLSEHQCKIETPFSIIYIDFKNSQDQLLEILEQKH